MGFCAYQKGRGSYIAETRELLPANVDQNLPCNMGVKHLLQRWLASRIPVWPPSQESEWLVLGGGAS